MEQIIGEHLSLINSYRSFELIFVIEPIFIKSIDKINFINRIVFIKRPTLGLLFEGIYLNKKREGLWIYWHPNGQKYSEGNYRNGKEEGLWISWRSNGQKWTEGNYQNGKLINEIIF